MVEINNASGAPVKKNAISRAVGYFLDKYGLSGKEVSIAFVKAEDMKRINREHRGIDSRTDVLAFVGENDMLGEIIMDYGMIRRQAREDGKEPGDELYFVLFHGLLHLAGYDDENEEDRHEMIRIGQSLLDGFLAADTDAARGASTGGRRRSDSKRRRK